MLLITREKLLFAVNGAAGGREDDSFQAFFARGFHRVKESADVHFGVEAG